MVEVKLNNSNKENPFYGLRNCLQLFQKVGHSISQSLLDQCWEEVKSNKEHKEMFFSLLFSVGDVTARQHNIFGKKKIDSGGNANREGFYTIFMWLKEKHPEQFIKFLDAGLFNEYTCFDLLFKSRVKTSNKRVIEVFDVFSDAKYRKDLAAIVCKIINGTNPFNKLLIAKFLTLPRMTKRSKHTKMLDETKRVMGNKALFLVELSELMGWNYDFAPNYANFKGYRAWRKEYNQDLESVLFSSGKIKEFTRDEFLDWFDKLPSQARYRVKNRLLYSKHEGTEVNRYPDMKKWYLSWEKFKEEKQAEQRKLEEKIRQGNASEEDKTKLKQVKKEAKVNVGATNFNEIYQEICNGKVDALKVEAFMNKVNLPYNNLVILDSSGSMSGAPYNFASFLASVCLVKNPDDDGRNLLGFFDTFSRFFSYIDKETKSPNSIVRGRTTNKVKVPFVNPELSFIDNYKHINGFCRANFGGGGTNIAAIPEGFKIECDNNPEILDALRNYPVWTIISDGEFNSMYSPESSMNDFMRRCENYFGFRPYIIAIDIASGYYSSSIRSANVERFVGIDNFMYIPSNPAQIEQILTNFKDMDVFDVYTPLQSLWRSNRYELVRNNTL